MKNTPKLSELMVIQSFSIFSSTWNRTLDQESPTFGQFGANHQSLEFDHAVKCSAEKITCPGPAALPVD